MKSLKLLALSVSVIAASSSYAATDAVMVQPVANNAVTAVSNLGKGAVNTVGTLGKGAVNSVNELGFLFKPAAVRVEGGTLGYGGALVYSVTPRTDIEAGFSSSDDFELFSGLEIKDVDYDVAVDPNKNAFLNARFRPFAGNMHVTTGILFQDNRLQVTGTAEDTTDKGEFTFDGKTYQVNRGSQVRGVLDYKNEVAPYVGVGFSPSITERVGGFFEIGAAYAGNTDVTVRSDLAGGTAQQFENGQMVGNTLTESEFSQIARKELKEEDILSEVLPVVKVGLTVRF